MRSTPDPTELGNYKASLLGGQHCRQCEGAPRLHTRSWNPERRSIECRPLFLNKRFIFCVVWCKSVSISGTGRIVVGLVSANLYSVAILFSSMPTPPPQQSCFAKRQ